MNFDPIHWACVALGVILTLTLTIGGSMYWKQGQDLRVCTAEFETHKAKTASAGAASELRRVGTEHELAQAAVNIQERYNAKAADLDRIYAEYKRLRDDRKRDSGRSKTVDLTDASEGLECTAESEARLNTAMGNLEDGVLVRLAKTRDEAVIYAHTCKFQLDEMYKIVNR